MSEKEEGMIIGVMDPAGRWIFGTCKCDFYDPDKGFMLKDALLSDVVLFPQDSQGNRIKTVTTFRSLSPVGGLLDVAVKPIVWFEVIDETLKAAVIHQRDTIRAAASGLTVPEGKLPQA